MTDQVVFARVSRSVIRRTEHYLYHADVSGNPYTERRGTPTGSIEVIVPYDGENHVSAQAIADLERQMPTAWQQQKLEARVGFIGLVNLGHTDMVERFDLASVISYRSRMAHGWPPRPIVMHGCLAYRMPAKGGHMAARS